MLHHTYSFLGVETYEQTSTEKIPAGPVTVKMLFEADKPKPGTGGTVTLWANGKLVGEGKMLHTVPVAFSSYAGMDIGRDNGLVVDRAYEDKAPYAFTGTVKKVVFASSAVAEAAPAPRGSGSFLRGYRRVKCQIPGLWCQSCTNHPAVTTSSSGSRVMAASFLTRLRSR